MLAFQVGSSAAALKRVPLDEDEVLSKTNFVQGKCFYTMGEFFVAGIGNKYHCQDVEL